MITKKRFMEAASKIEHPSGTGQISACGDVQQNIVEAGSP